MQVNMCVLAVATQKDITEVDIKGLLHPPQWLEDETEYDIEMLKGLVTYAIMKAYNLVNSLTDGIVCNSVLTA